MTSHFQTTTGHSLSDASFLDAHYQSAQIEYEDALRYVGIETGWKVLDAGSGGGGFLPLLSELVGPKGSVVALDLAPENVARVRFLVGEGKLPRHVEAVPGSLTSLPFPDCTFDCVWSANVFQYLTEAEATVAIDELNRVLKPGGLLAIKEFDNSTFDFLPMPINASASLMIARRTEAEAASRLSAGSGPSLPRRLRAAGLANIRRRTWVAERWAPVGKATRIHVTNVFQHFASIVDRYDVGDDVKKAWRDAGADPNRLIDDPDFCYREGFVVAVGSKEN